MPPPGPRLQLPTWSAASPRPAGTRREGRARRARQSRPRLACSRPRRPRRLSLRLYYPTRPPKVPTVSPTLPATGEDPVPGRAVPAHSGRVAATFRLRPAAVAGMVASAGFLLVIAALDVANTQTWHGRIHGVGFLILVFASIVVPFVLAAALLRNPQARWLAWLALGVGIATVVVVFVPNAKGSYSNWFGPASKLHLLITFGFLEVIAIWLWTSALRSEASART